MTIPALNLRHLRAFREVARHNSISAASSRVFLSQPAITQAIAKLEKTLDTALFERTAAGMFVTTPGGLFLARVNRALDFIATGARQASRLGPRGRQRDAGKFARLLTFSQLKALVAVSQAGNFSLAARRIEASQPSLHRSARELERLAGI
ncbi:MAG TPA: LysR family transcriptional regulator, partial [Rhizobiales bacterium]|nr:LysR family transcriptional regulator [Hyphomicrobiales bacterium]